MADLSQVSHRRSHIQNSIHAPTLLALHKTMKTLAFLNLKHRTQDADGKPVDDYRYEVGDEMIVRLDDETQQAIGETHKGIFRFKDLKKEELSPFASLSALTGIHFTDGHYKIRQ